ncbi:MAG: redox-sensing transcriptional repressor Rex [Oscillospiraceae bacterium]|jgi:redox-sensing transcriptional repressor|nr:redox-sensing transcriptional repressor Rex [Oscillospiraceae bacterium]
MKQLTVPLPAYHRITQYLNYLNHLPESAPENISATTIAEALDLNDVVVRKDLACVSGHGKPKVGYLRIELAAAISRFLGHEESYEAALVGAGRLGQALLTYENFAKYGLSIVIAFDTNPLIIGRRVGGAQVFGVERIAELCMRLGIKIGIITAPGRAAQGACDALVEGGVRRVWNFAPVPLKAPKDVVIKNEDMAASLAILLKQDGKGTVG